MNKLIKILAVFLMNSAVFAAPVSVVDYGSNSYVTADANMTTYLTTGGYSITTALSPSSGYTGPTFYGGYGRSNNGSVDTPRIVNDQLGVGADVMGWTEGSLGTVDRMYGSVMFLQSDFLGGLNSGTVSMDAASVFSINTAKAFVPDQNGFIRFLVIEDGIEYISDATSFTTGTTGSWSEKTITLSDPSSQNWYTYNRNGSTAEYTGSGTLTSLNFDNVTGVGFNFSTVATVTNGAGRIYVDQFSVTAIPEPSSLMLLGLAGLGAALFLRRRR